MATKKMLITLFCIALYPFITSAAADASRPNTLQIGEETAITTSIEFEKIKNEEGIRFKGRIEGVLINTLVEARLYPCGEQGYMLDAEINEAMPFFGVSQRKINSPVKRQYLESEALNASNKMLAVSLYRLLSLRKLQVATQAKKKKKKQKQELAMKTEEQHTFIEEK